MRRHKVKVISCLLAAQAWLPMLLVSCFAQASKQTLDEAFRLQSQGKNAPAREVFERILIQARIDNNSVSEAEASRGLGLIANAEGRYIDAKAHFTASLALFEARHIDRGIGRAANGLGFAEFSLGAPARAGEAFRRSKEAFERSGELGEVASALYNLTFTTSGLEELEHLNEGLRLARKIGDARMEGMLLHVWADRLFAGGLYTEANAKLEQASVLMERAGAKKDLARVLTSLGRLQRAHGAYQKAQSIYQRSLAIQQETGDIAGQVQSINSLIVVCAYLNNCDRAKLQEEALTLARRTGSPRTISAQLTRFAGWRILQKNYAVALQLLEDAVRIVPEPVGETYERLAQAYRGLKRYPQALDAANRAVELTRKLQDDLRGTLLGRAQVLMDLGRNEEALADVREGIRVIERLRASALPNDEMRRGFAEQQVWYNDNSIFLLHATGRDEEAMQTAERARARAFLDLLAARDSTGKPDGQMQLPTLGDRQGQLQTEHVNLAAREGSAAAAEAIPAGAGGLASLAVRLGSTLLTYWVTDEVTFIWVLNPQSGAIVRSVRVPVKRERLEQLVAATWSGLPSSPRREPRDSRSVAGRGEDAVQLPAMRKDAWRELYRLLIAPARHFLPEADGSLLTIIPHGPLFRLSFAGLLDERSRYLIERYRVHYAPSASVLAYTNQKKQKVSAKPPSYLVVADPSGMPRTPDGKALPQLPGSRREAYAISNLRQGRDVLLVLGADAQEQHVRRLLRDRTVIHFATHGIVRDDMPFDSYLALGVSGNRDAEDGRLTAGDLYQLDINADLIVLSACRSGLGHVSMDGVVGLTRAFFYAGAASIMATVWDVADEPTARLMTDFYRIYGKSGEKSGALRTAQLQLLRALRARQIKIATPAGEVVLPEHPLFWAGFTLAGEP